MQFDADRASVTGYSEAFFVECMRRYIADIVAATDEEVLSSLAAVYNSLTVPTTPLGAQDLMRDL